MLDQEISHHIKVMHSLKLMEDNIHKASQVMAGVISEGGKILICGNGGSAADAQHFSAEIIGRFRRERKAWPAIALTTDTSILTAVGNDYGYAEVFARQIEGLGLSGDAFVGISTSGNSVNIINATKMAKKLGITTIGLLGCNGGELIDICDLSLVVPDENTPRIQEAHIFLLHYIAGSIEAKLTEGRE